MERGATRAHTLRNRARVSAAGGMVALAGVLGLQGSLAADGLSLVVDSTRDAVDARLGDGVCATAAADCTLRAAIQEANALAGPQQIVLPAGTYALALRPQNDNLADNGDWDVTGPVDDRRRRRRRRRSSTAASHRRDRPPTPRASTVCSRSTLPPATFRSPG